MTSFNYFYLIKVLCSVDFIICLFLLLCVCFHEGMLLSELLKLLTTLLLLLQTDFKLNLLMNAELIDVLGSVNDLQLYV